jgi:branched-chain amino acid transport system ATP-binding protein
MLELSGVNTFYEKSHILHDVSLEIREGEIIGLLGRNGVGKSTTLKSVIGIVVPESGSIRFEKQEIRGLRPYRIARLGIGYVPEDRRVFPTLTVRENLLMGMKRGKKPNQDVGWTIERVYECFPRLQERDSFKGGLLSGGEQQMLTIGRTLMGDPKLVLLDEPTEGLAPQVVETVAGVIREIHRSGVSVLLVEQAMEMVLELASHVLIMNKGEIVFRGTPEDLRSRPDIREQYLEVA